MHPIFPKSEYEHANRFFFLSRGKRLSKFLQKNMELST